MEHLRDVDLRDCLWGLRHYTSLPKEEQLVQREAGVAWGTSVNPRISRDDDELHPQLTFTSCHCPKPVRNSTGRSQSISLPLKQPAICGGLLHKNSASFISDS